VTHIPGAIAFTDLVGFTEYTAERGDERALAVLDAQSRMVDAAMPPGARVVKELGDGLMLWFADPIGAVTTCLELRDRFDGESFDEAPLGVRMGLHWGTPTPRGTDFVGHDVNIAARIVELAGPGELLVSESARAPCAGHVPDLVLQELGPMVMKGIPEPVRLFRAERAAMVGRIPVT
jgi:adenylate cyclase